jgi:hypothetical protein
LIPPFRHAKLPKLAKGPCSLVLALGGRNLYFLAILREAMKAGNEEVRENLLICILGIKKSIYK